MSLTARLIWYIERHLDEPLSLSRVARANSVSVFYVTRLFSLMCGQPLMAYVRARRLTEAARAIRDGADILDAAIGAGYASHEAFARAFRQQFGVSPKTLRQPDTRIHLTEPFSMNDTTVNPRPELAPQTPRVVSGPEREIAGLSGRFDFTDLTGIPGLWQSFRHWFGQIDGQKGGVSYGVSYAFRPEGINYLAGVEVEPGSDLPPGFSTVTLGAGRYAVFEHHGHVSGISHTWQTIYDSWLPASGLKVRYDPCFERQDERFNSATGTGVVEIWVPVG